MEVTTRCSGPTLVDIDRRLVRRYSLAERDNTCRFNLGVQCYYIGVCLMVKERYRASRLWREVYLSDVWSPAERHAMFASEHYGSR